MSKTKDRAKAARARRKAREAEVADAKAAKEAKKAESDRKVAEAFASKPWEVGDVVYAVFSEAGKHPGVVLSVRADGRLDIARGVTWRPDAPGRFGAQWFSYSFLVTDGEAERVGLRHATRFDFVKVESIPSSSVERVGRVSPKGAFKERWDAATFRRAPRP